MIFDVIAAPGAAEFLESGVDPCFGKAFARSTAICIECRAPVVIEGKIRLMREVCSAKQRGADQLADLHRLTSREVLQRLERGDSITAIFKEILGDLPPEMGGAAARQLLVDRLVYLKTVGVATNPVPSYKAILKEEVPK